MFYRSQCYEPQTHGTAYATAYEEPNMFGPPQLDDPNLIPRDRRHKDRTDHGEQSQQYTDLKAITYQES